MGYNWGVVWEETRKNTHSLTDSVLAGKNKRCRVTVQILRFWIAPSNPKVGERFELQPLLEVSIHISNLKVLISEV